MSKIQSIMAARAGGTKDPDRLQLAIAISAAAEARKAVDNAAAARGRALRMVDEAEDRLAAAKEGVTAAKDALTRRVTLSAQSGTTLSPDSELRNSRLFEQECIDGLDAARASLAAVEAMLECPIEILKVAERRVGDLSRTILARAIEPTIADIRRQKAALLDSIAVLHFLKKSCVADWPPSSEESRLRNCLRIEAQGGVCFEPDFSNSRAAERWAEYFAHLKLDADAAPPSI
jgi:hypothetical protein